MKKIMMLLVGFLVAAPFVFARDTGMKTQLETDINMRALLIQFEDKLGTTDTGDYLRNLQEVVSGDNNDEASYRSLIKTVVTDPTVNDDAYHFVRLTNLFYYLLNKPKLEIYEGPIFDADVDDVINTVSGAGIDDYQEFYNAVKDISGSATASTYILPTMAIWKNRSYHGIAPFRLEDQNNFWGIPTQVAKMYNTMAKINHEDAINFFKASLESDFGAYPRLPEYDEESENEEQVVKHFFDKFAEVGEFAKQDAADFRDAVLNILEAKKPKPHYPPYY